MYSCTYSLQYLFHFCLHWGWFILLFDFEHDELEVTCKLLQSSQASMVLLSHHGPWLQVLLFLQCQFRRQLLCMRPCSNDEADETTQQQIPLEQLPCSWSPCLNHCLSMVVQNACDVVVYKMTFLVGSVCYIHHFQFRNKRYMGCLKFDAAYSIN